MTTKLASLTSFWQSFNLPVVQSQLDVVATEITDRQDLSEQSRKILIDQMRDFKKNQTEEVRAAVTGLVKSFQNEVDMLNKRAKSAEKDFFDVYKKLADLADPVPILEHALEQQNRLGKMADMEIETKQLRETIQDYNKEIQDYKVKEKKMKELQTKVDSYDRNIDETLNVRIKDVTDQMLEEYNEKLRIIEEAKEAAGRKNEDLEAKLRSVQRQLQECQSELFEANNKKEEKHNAKSEEVEILLNDLEVSNERASSAEREILMLKERMEELKKESLAKIRDDKDKLDAADEESFENPNLARELSAKEREVQQLMSDIQKMKQEKQDEARELDVQISQANLRNDELNKTVAALELKLQRQSDYDSIKKDLSILKTMEFSQNQDDTDEDFESEANKRPLEVMILERSKVLQSENTSLRMEKDRLSDDLVSTKRELVDKTKEWERQQRLVTELEDHVERLQELSTSNRGEAEGRSSADILDTLDLSSPQHSDFPMLGTSPVSPTLEGADESSKALLPIIQAQRERFRQRNEELEEEQSKHINQITILQKEVEDMQADNVKLYEKIRYLQGYQGRSGNNAPSGSAHSGSTVVSMAESRYQSQYEKKLDPFSTFNHQERQKRYGQLNFFEKIILSFVQFMMGNKFARLGVFCYSILLHALVFMVLMKLAYNEAYRRDLASEWHDKYMQHMEDHHHEGNNPMG